MTTENTWSSWCYHVLKELERHDGDYTKLRSDVDKMIVEFAIMKGQQHVKSSIWGAFSGMGVYLLLYILTNLLKGIM